MRAAAEAVAPGGTLLVVGNDLQNLTSGYGGPQDPAVMCSPRDIVTDIEPVQLVVVREETVPRSVSDGGGQPLEALDALVLALPADSLMPASRSLATTTATSGSTATLIGIPMRCVALIPLGVCFSLSRALGTRAERDVPTGGIEWNPALRSRRPSAISKPQD